MIRRLYKSPFARNVMLVASGTAGAQVITMAFSPLITRIYGPEAFGLLGVFMALATVLSPISALTYPIAIVLPKKDLVAKDIAKLAFWLALIISAIIGIILLFTGEILLKLVGSESISKYVMLLPVTMFFAALLQIIQQWLIRKNQFKLIAKVSVIQSLIINSVKTGFGLLNPTAALLIIIATSGAALHFLMLLLGIKRNQVAKTEITPHFNKKIISEVANKYKDFPLYRAPQVFINAISQSLPILMLASFFGPAAAGFYALAKTVMGLPANLIGKSVADVFYPRITNAAQNRENLFDLIMKATLVLLLIGFIPFAIVFLFGPKIFLLLFGDNWGTAGEYAKWLSLFFLFNFINKPSVASVPVLGLEKGLLLYEVFSTLIKIFGLFIGFYLFNDAILAIALFSILGVLAYTIMMLWILCHSKQVSNEKTSK